MQIRTRTVTLSTHGCDDVQDVTPQLAHLVRAEGLRDGSVLVFVGGSTGAVTTIEFESGAVADLRGALDRLAPRDLAYDHDARWGDGNGYAHVRAALLQADLEIPVAAGRLMLGTWQQVVFCEFDNRPRDRRIICQLRGAFEKEDQA